MEDKDINEIEGATESPDADTQDEFEVEITEEATETEDTPSEVEIIGVRFKQSGKIYYFDPAGITAEDGSNVIVETARGIEYGNVALGNRMVPSSEIVPPLRRVIRNSTAEDDLRHEENVAREKEAFDICNTKILEHKLEMKLIDVEYTFDNNKLLFYFTADGRIDFRELVKDLASVFKTRIELRQIGIRDEAKMLGGLGICGRPFCCSSFLGDFVQVSIKMAKDQNLSLNSAKISGSCGRLMCCLRYEYDTYEEEIRKTPKADTVVITPDGEGTITEVRPLSGEVRVRLSKEPDQPPKVYHRDNIYVKGEERPEKFGEKAEEKRPELRLENDEIDAGEGQAPEKKSDDSRERRPRGDRRRGDRRGDRRSEGAFDGETRKKQDKAKPQSDQAQADQKKPAAAETSDGEARLEKQNDRRGGHQKGQQNRPHNQQQQWQQSQGQKQQKRNNNDRNQERKKHSDDAQAPDNQSVNQQKKRENENQGENRGGEARAPKNEGERRQNPRRGRRGGRGQKPKNPNGGENGNNGGGNHGEKVNNS